MRWILRLKSWQLLILLIIPIILGIQTSNFFDQKYKSIIFHIYCLAFAYLFLLWLFFVSQYLSEKIVIKTKLNLTIAKLNLVSNLLSYLLFVLFLHTSIFSKNLSINYFSPILFLSGLGNYYMIYFVSKSIVSIEKNIEVQFNEFIIEFFLLGSIILGILYVQGRIRNIFINS